REMKALLEPAPLDLRVNPLKTTREKAFAVLKEAGLPVELGRYSPFGLRIKDRPALNRIALLRDGAVEIQDEGSQLVALLVAPKPGERVVDFCAGAGGKTLALAALMENKGRIVACDVLANRLKRSAERFRRAGIHNIEIKPLTTEHDPWVKRHKEGFDRVLVDAPCSGTGTWRRNPDGRWRSLGPGLETLLPLQASILESAARLVKPGGRLVYATCSLLPEENDEQIEKFLAAHADFKVIPVQEASGALPDLPPTGPYLALTPHAHHTDGFFAAVLERTTMAKGEENSASTNNSSQNTVIPTKVGMTVRWVV
ncbi:MAG: RsmB/NOP family class I SAM-dependent RNA methyltransferase, partial [Alphaproteobacteria bacterium]|nr:RsmB/NOP family class I SAM-dependent RNA methyltransferase [Alphaproteobacteria bacterium]